jgi:FkbM family methyltransferase
LIASRVQPLIIDCGANIGLSGVWYARQFPEAKIIAVEPDQSNLEIASRNLAAYPNVTLVSGGVWDTPSHLSIVNPDAEPWAFRVEEGEGSIPGFTIDQLSEGKPILVVKVDIEGAEKELFRSNTDWMDRTDLNRDRASRLAIPQFRDISILHESDCWAPTSNSDAWREPFLPHER